MADVLARLQEDIRLRARQEVFDDPTEQLMRDAYDEVERLRALLAEARDKGLIYWEPNTERGRAAKADMLDRIDKVLGPQAENDH